MSDFQQEFTVHRDRIIAHIKQRIYPLTFRHIAYLLFFTAITFFITGYILRFKLIKWIYVTTFLLLLAAAFKQGDDGEAIDDILKLSRI